MSEKPISKQMQSAYETFTLARIDAWTDKVAKLESRIQELEAEIERRNQPVSTPRIPQREAT